MTCLTTGCSVGYGSGIGLWLHLNVTPQFVALTVR